MSCLKCGQEVAVGQVFCDSCLADMEKHPVKPGTPVIIPKQNKPLPSKRNYKRAPKPEELIAAQRQFIGWLLATIVILILAIAVLSITVLHLKGKLNDLSLLENTSAVEIVSRETHFDNM